MALQLHVVVVWGHFVRAYLVCLVGLFFALMALGLSQGSSSPKTSYAVIHTSLLSDGKAHLKKVPLLPVRMLTVSLFSRGVLRVNHPTQSTGWDNIALLPIHWAAYITDFSKLFLSDVAFPVLHIFYFHSKYRLAAGKEANLIYRFIHAR